MDPSEGFSGSTFDVPALIGVDACDGRLSSFLKSLAYCSKPEGQNSCSNEMKLNYKF